MFLIIFNVIILAMVRYPISPSEEEFQTILNNVFTFYFFVEIVVKLVGLGFREFFRDRFNQFDTIIVLAGMIEVIIDFSSSRGANLRFLTIFRSFRLFKLARHIKSLRNLLTILFNTLLDLRNFTVLLILFMVVVSLFGMEFFAYKARFGEHEHPLHENL